MTHEIKLIRLDLAIATEGNGSEERLESIRFKSAAVEWRDGKRSVLEEGNYTQAQTVFVRLAWLFIAHHLRTPIPKSVLSKMDTSHLRSLTQPTRGNTFVRLLFGESQRTGTKTKRLIRCCRLVHLFKGLVPPQTGALTINTKRLHPDSIEIWVDKNDLGENRPATKEVLKLIIDQFEPIGAVMLTQLMSGTPSDSKVPEVASQHAHFKEESAVDSLENEDHVELDRSSSDAVITSDYEVSDVASRGEHPEQERAVAPVELDDQGRSQQESEPEKRRTRRLLWVVFGSSIAATIVLGVISLPNGEPDPPAGIGGELSPQTHIVQRPVLQSGSTPAVKEVESRRIDAQKLHVDLFGLKIADNEDDSVIIEVLRELESGKQPTSFQALLGTKPALLSYASQGAQESMLVADILAMSGTRALESGETTVATQLCEDALGIRGDCRSGLRLKLLIAMEEGFKASQEFDYLTAYEQYVKAGDLARAGKLSVDDTESKHAQWWQDRYSDAVFAIGVVGLNIGDERHLSDAKAAFISLIPVQDEQSSISPRRRTLIQDGLGKCEVLMGNRAAAVRRYRLATDAASSAIGSSGNADEVHELVHLRNLAAIGWADNTVNLGLVDQTQLEEISRILIEYLGYPEEVGGPGSLPRGEQCSSSEHDIALMTITLAKVKYRQYLLRPVPRDLSFLAAPETTLNDSIERLSAIFDGEPANTSIRHGLATARILEGTILEQKKQRGQAIESYKSGLKLLEEGNPVGAESQLFARSRVRAELAAGILCSATGRLLEGNLFLANALRDIESISAETPDAELLQISSLAHLWLTEHALAGGEISVAKVHASSSVADVRKALASLPDSAKLKQRLATGLMAQAKTDGPRNGGEAIERIREAAKILERLPADSEVIRLQRSAAELEGLGQLDQDRPDIAAECFANALAFNEILKDGNSERYLRLLLAEAFQLCGQFDEAIETRKLALRTLEREVPQDTESLATERANAMIFEGVCDRLRGNFEHASELYALALSELDETAEGPTRSDLARVCRLGIRFCEAGSVVERSDDLSVEDTNTLFRWRAQHLAAQGDQAGLLQLAERCKALELPLGQGAFSAACCYGKCLKLALGWKGVGAFHVEDVARKDGKAPKFRESVLAALSEALDDGFAPRDLPLVDADFSALWSDERFREVVIPADSASTN